MRHLQIYESFSKISRKGRDLFELEFKKILHNRTIITGPVYNEDKIEELFSDKIQYKLIDNCYPFMNQYTLDESEIKRSECAEKNIREYLGNKLEDLDCEIVYYRPMYIHRRYPYDPIKIYAPGANRGSGNEFTIEAKFYSRNDDAAMEKMPEIIAKAKEFAKEYGVTHVLPHGPNIVQDPLRILSKPEEDVESISNFYPKKEPVFTPIEKFKWEKYYW